MQVFVRHIVTSTFDVEIDTSIKEFKQMIQDKIGIPPFHQLLTANGRVMVEPRTFKDFNILPFTTFTLAVKMLSCKNTCCKPKN